MQINFNKVTLYIYIVNTNKVLLHNGDVKDMMINGMYIILINVS